MSTMIDVTLEGMARKAIEAEAAVVFPGLTWDWGPGNQWLKSREKLFLMVEGESAHLLIEFIPAEPEEREHYRATLGPAEQVGYSVYGCLKPIKNKLEAVRSYLKTFLREPNAKWVAE